MRDYAIILLFILIINAIPCKGQNRRHISHYTLQGRPEKSSITDKELIKYILDSTQVFITAIDKNGRQLWKTDAWKNSKTEEYRVKRPIIVSFQLGDYYYGDTLIYVNKLKGKQAQQIRKYRSKYTTEVIWITYNNTQYGVIDKRTGRFVYMGQD